MPRASLTRLCTWLLAVILSTSVARAYDPIEWAPSLAEAQKRAQDQSRLVLVHFWSESCGPCMRLNRTVFNRREFVRSLHGNYIPVKVNVEERSELARQFQIRSIPTDVILTPDGHEVHRTISPADPNRYIAMLDEVAAHARLARTPPAPTSMQLSETTSVSTGDVAAPQPTVRAGAVGNPNGQLIENPFARALPAERAQGISIYSQQAGNTQLAVQHAPPADQDAGGPTTPAPPEVPQPGAQSATQPPRRSIYSQQPSGSPDSGTATAGQPRDVQRTGGQVAARPDDGTGTSAQATQGPPPALSANNADQRSAQQQPSRQQPATENPMTPWANSQGAPIIRPETTEQPSAIDPRLAGSRHAPAGSTQMSSPRNEPAPIVASPAVQTLGLDGYCPVSLVENERWDAGSPRWQSIYEGRTYFFAGPEQLERFKRAPAHYCPFMSGFDVVRFHEQGVLVPGKREHGRFAKNESGQPGGYYLFADEVSLEKFIRENRRTAKAQATNAAR